MRKTAMSEFDNGNSLVRGDEPEERPQKELEQFDGVAQMKRKQTTSFLSWVSKMFFSGKTWKDILKEVVEQQIVPELKDSARNAIVSAIDMKFYKDYTPGSSVSTTVNNGSFITKYLDYSSASTKSTQQNLEANQKKDEEIRKNGYELPTFTSEEKAMSFLKSMKVEAERFGQLSVHDIAWKQGKNVDYTWDAYGWTKEQILAIKRPTRISPAVVINGVKYTHMIELPKAKLLESE